ncbi:zinc-binding dehydrogenase [Halomonas sp. PAMB 3264]|uniref:zinc-binding dehydrogenase n=1 Tax=unclassified Halomonas TaxID=2609666 RepID=UPI00289A8A59|nr:MULTISPECIES: zinc-binding dehydrogenase [unclassified Halomonas]WNL39994.1 zinc-binding dehydrogenase [Halomonas sp. PAMB 3232]WNL43302.1 zinc-binding dehydrogenase [Halomonas sp. PAMB 3264]
MKAWYKESLKAPLVCAERPDPICLPGSVIVDVRAVHVPAYLMAMVDSTDIPLPVPLVLGAGGVGVVREKADDVFNVHVGDVVALDCLVESGDTDYPEDVLMGLGEIGGRGLESDVVDAMRTQWRDGTMAQKARLPKEAVTRLPGAEHFDDPGRLAFLTWLGIAGEGVEQSGQTPGDIVAILGATGQMGGAAVLVALAKGASRVIALGRNEAALEKLATLDPRVVPVRLTNDVDQDASAMTAVAGAPHVVIDTMGDADSANPLLAGFAALRDSGTLVMMGGVRMDIPMPYGEILRRRLTIRGSRMYRPETVLSIWRMIEAGLIDLSRVGMVEVGIDDPKAAIETATKTTGLNFVSLRP